MLLLIGENGRLVCYVPDTDHKSSCTYNFAVYDKSIYPNPLHPLVDYMIKPQKYTKKCTNLPSQNVHVNILSIYGAVYCVHIRVSCYHCVMYAINRLPWVNKASGGK